MYIYFHLATLATESEHDLPLGLLSSLSPRRLSFTQYCCYQNGMVYGIRNTSRGGTYVAQKACNRIAIV